MDFLQTDRRVLGEGAVLPLLKLGDSGEVYYELALEMLREIEKNNAERRRTVIICPVGPVGQYPIFVRIVNRDGISLKNCWFINMDEYLDDDDAFIEISHPLSFRGFMQREVYGRIRPDLLMAQDRRIFPDPSDVAALPGLIRELGGVDLVIGGIGINGHVAFNEPRPELSVEEFAALSVRALDISPETRAVNAVGSLGGALSSMPRRCVTVGMREILGARRVRLACFRDWHRAVVRRAAYGPVGSDFPVSLLQGHADARILLNDVCAERPF